MGGKGEKCLIKTVQREWTRGGRGARGMRGMRGGRSRLEQRTGVGGFTGMRGEKEKNIGKKRGNVMERTTIVKISEEPDMETCDTGRGQTRSNTGRNEERKERSSPGKC